MDSIFQTETDYLTIDQASAWASEKTGTIVTRANIDYLIRYDQIHTFTDNGLIMVRAKDLDRYYGSRNRKRENEYRKKLGEDLNWHLSFDQFKESQTTKHVHRLHPYKGKYIPQLVEYFLDDHTDEFKKTCSFAPGDIVLDPFCGSGTTLVQANELGIHAVGIDVSHFNSMISNLKLSNVNPAELLAATSEIRDRIAANPEGVAAQVFEQELLVELNRLNGEHYPSPKFRNLVKAGEIDEDSHAKLALAEFHPTYCRLLREHGVDNTVLASSEDFLERWYLPSVRSQVESAKDAIDRYPDSPLRDMLRLILSRTLRSSRATTHRDLATLVKPVTEPYYCRKHGKICKPLFSMLGWWNRYSSDSAKRLSDFGELKTDTFQCCLTGDSREIDIFSELELKNKQLANIARKQRIRGIFSSPPYVGMIDYHEQHAYAYALFDFPRNDANEIGPMSSGKSRQARESYVSNIAAVLNNCKKYLAADCDVFLVANDQFGLYPQIAQLAEMEISNEFRRPVLNRAEGDRGAYSETIFQMTRR